MIVSDILLQNHVWFVINIMICLVWQIVGCFKDLFIAPTFDELEQVARDAKGNPRKLSMRQLKSIREHGSVTAAKFIFLMVT